MTALTSNLLFAILASYITAIFCLVISNKTIKQKIGKLFKLIFWIVLFVGLICHYYYAATTSYIAHSFNFSVASMTIWTSVLIVTALAIGSTFYPIKNLAIIILPISILCLIFAYLWGDQVLLIDQRDPLFYWHIGTSITAFTLLGLAVMQAILFSYQEISLRRHSNNLFITWLPPIQTMEKVLFQTVIAGFALLTIAISVGAIYNLQSNQVLFSFNHHNVLAIMSWISFAILLYGRTKLGWRGTTIILWTLIGFVLLKLGYFGTKIVTEFMIR